jgi:hypothetical protein
MKEVFYGWVDSIKPYPAEHLGSAICFGDGTGKFSLIDLPAEMQISPIFSFQKMLNNNKNESNYIFGGNFFGVIPYEGRYDAQALGMFSVSKNKNINFLPQQNLATLQTEIRDLKWLTLGNGKQVLTVAQNNDKLLFYNPN